MTVRLKALSAPVTLASPASRTGSLTSLIVDRLGWETVAFYLFVGAVATLTDSDKWTVSIWHADTLDGTFEEVPSSLLEDTFPILKNTNQAEEIFLVEYIGTKRFLRLVLTHTGSPSAFLSAWAVLGGPMSVLFGNPQQGL